MGFFAQLKNKLSLKKQTISSVSLMTDTGADYYSWHGDTYRSDIVRSCIRPKVRAIGKLTGKHIRETVKEDGSRNLEINPRPSIQMLLEEPNPLMSGQQLQERMAAQLCINNNAFAIICRDDLGNPVSIYPVVPVSARLVIKNGEAYIRFNMPNGKEFTFPYSDIIHLRDDYNENDIFGTPKAEALTPLMEVINTTDQGIINAVRNSSVIRWLLKFSNTMRAEDLKKQTEEFTKSFLSTESGTGAAAVGGNCEAIQVDAKDYVPNAAQMDRTTQRIFRMFNTNAKIVDSSRTEDEWEAYFDSEIEPVLRQMASEYTRKLFSRRERACGNRIAFEASSWDGASLTTKLNLLQMVDRGALTPNEWRYAFNLAPVPDGDKPIRRLDTAPVTETHKEVSK